MDDLDDLLARSHGADHVFADGALADLRDGVLDDRQGDIGLEQRHADFPQGRIDVFFRQHTAAGELVEYAAKSFCQCVEHAFVFLVIPFAARRWPERRPIRQSNSAPLSETFAEQGSRRPPPSVGTDVPVRQAFTLA